MAKPDELVEEYCPHCEEDTLHYFKESRGWVCVSCNLTGSESSGGGCVISTVVCASTGLGPDCRELRILRQFRDSYMVETEERRGLVRDYYEYAPAIAGRLTRSPRKQEICQVAYERFVLSAVGRIDSGDYGGVLKEYSEMICFLERELANEQG